MYVLKTGVEVLKLFSCSTQLCLADKYQITKHCNFFLAKHSWAWKFLLIDMTMPTKVGIFIFISWEISCSVMFSKKVFGIVSNLRFISIKNFMFSRVEHVRSFITSGPDHLWTFLYGPCYAKMCLRGMCRQRRLMHSLIRAFTVHCQNHWIP